MELLSTWLISGFWSIFSSMNYDSLAARRYRKYKWHKRTESVRKYLFFRIFQIFRAVIIAMQKAGIIRRTRVEIVTVE